MNLDELSYEELEDLLEITINSLKGVKSALDNVIKTLNVIEDVECDDIEHITEELVQAREDLSSAKTELELKCDDISNQMEYLEDYVDDFEERNSEYWKTQF